MRGDSTGDSSTGCSSANLKTGGLAALRSTMPAPRVNTGQQEQADDEIAAGHEDCQTMVASGQPVDQPVCDRAEDGRQLYRQPPQAEVHAKVAQTSLPATTATKYALNIAVMTTVV